MICYLSKNIKGTCNAFTPTSSDWAITTVCAKSETGMLPHKTPYVL